MRDTGLKGLVVVLACIAALFGVTERAGRMRALEQNRALLLKQEKTEQVHQMRMTELEAQIDDLENPKDGVQYHGQLAVQQGHLVDSKGDAIQLRGMSSHGIMWYPEFANYRALATTKSYGANLFRIAMYTEQSKGYIQNPEEAKKTVHAAIENVLGADMYAIVDWHVLRDEDPNRYVDEAMEFFGEISMRYADEPGILYEIANEPNGDTTWEDIRKYANQVIPVIRKNAPNAVVLVGTPRFCTDIQSAADHPLPYENIMYTYHFYTGSDSGGYRHNLTYALEKDTPVFITEWGITPREGSNREDLRKAEEFVGFLNQNHLSWANWSLSNKDGGHAAISGQSTALSWWDESELTESGRFIFKALAGADEDNR